MYFQAWARSRSFTSEIEMTVCTTVVFADSRKKIRPIWGTTWRKITILPDTRVIIVGLFSQSIIASEDICENAQICKSKPTTRLKSLPILPVLLQMLPVLLQKLPTSLQILPMLLQILLPIQYKSNFDFWDKFDLRNNSEKKLGRSHWKERLDLQDRMFRKLKILPKYSTC